MSILVVAAHPDDEILGCGATIARLSRTDAVHILLMGQGLGARNLPPDDYQRGLQRLAEASVKAAAWVGASVTLGSDCFQDNAFDAGPLLPLVRVVEQHIQRLQPTTIYTHHAGDLNVDHRMTFQAVLTACRPVQDSPVRNIYSFEVPSATDWAFQQVAPWNPTRFVSIQDTVETKLLALACYDTEMRAFPHPRSPEAIRARATWWGGVVGMPAAEAFMVIRDLEP